MKSFKIRERMGKNFRYAVIMLFYWVFIHVFLAAHSEFFPSAVLWISKLDWKLFAIVTLLITYIHISNETVFSRLFEINLKNTIPFDLALVVFTMVEIKLRLKMLCFLSYIFIVGSTLSALTAKLFSWNNDVIMWGIYGVLCGATIFLLKVIFCAWMVTHQYLLNNLAEE